MKKIVLYIIIAVFFIVGCAKYKESQLTGTWTIYDEQQKKNVPVFELRNSGYLTFYGNYFNIDCDELLKDGSFRLKKDKLSLNFTVRIQNVSYQSTNAIERMAYGDNAKGSKNVMLEEVQGSIDFTILSLNDEELVLLDSNILVSGQGSQSDHKYILKKKR